MIMIMIMIMIVSWAPTIAGWQSCSAGTQATLGLVITIIIIIAIMIMIMIMFSVGNQLPPAGRRAVPAHKPLITGARAAHTAHSS